MSFRAAGFAPRAKYSAHTMNEHQRVKLNSPSHSPKGMEMSTVSATASQSGTVSLVTTTVGASWVTSVMRLSLG